MTRVTLQALQKIGKGTAEKTSLQTIAENSQGRRRRDVVDRSKHEQRRPRKLGRRQ